MWRYLSYDVELKPNKNYYAQNNLNYIKTHKRKELGKKKANC